MRHLFANPWFLVLLTALPGLGLLALGARRRRRQALAQLGPLLIVRRRPPLLRGLCWFLGMLLLGIGVAGPQWGKEWDQAVTGRDLIVVLDCSRSMLAENPSRLRRARIALLDLCGEMQKRGGHRLGLIVFAGKARVLCPLTHDYDHFRDALGSEKDVESLSFDPEIAPGPQEASGTRIGAGLQEALAQRDPRYPGGCEILLLSDGDDPARDGEWERGAVAARDAGVPVDTVGVGNPNPDEEEAKLVINREVQRSADGKAVLTRLEEEPLRRIARISHGIYVAMQTRPLALGRWYLDSIADKPAREDSDDALPVYQPRYLWFLAPAFVLLCVAFVVPFSRERSASATIFSARGTLAAKRMVLFGVVLMLAAAPIADTTALLREGNAAFRRGDYATAAERYERAGLRTTDPVLAAFNLAAAKYRLALESAENRTKDLEEAAQDFRCCLDKNDPHRARALSYLGACLLQQALDGDTGRAEEAVARLEECLREQGLDEASTEDARHNLALARLLLAQMPPGSPDTSRPPEKPPEGDPQAPKPKPKKRPLRVEDSLNPDDDQTKGQTDPRTKPGDVKTDMGRPDNDPREAKTGRDNTPRGPDGQAIDPPDVKYLQDAFERIHEEQQAYKRKKALPPAPGVKDW